MKTTSITAILCLSISLQCFSQKSPVKFGDIPLQNMKMTSYVLDSSASGIVLADYGEVLQDEYPNLKEFYNQIVAKQSEQIVIRKK